MKKGIMAFAFTALTTLTTFAADGGIVVGFDGGIVVGFDGGIVVGFLKAMTGAFVF